MWSSPATDRARDRVDRGGRVFASARRRVLIGPKKAVDCLSFNSGGTRLAAGGRDQTIRVWTVDWRKDPTSASSGLQESTELRGHTDEVSSLSWCTGSGSTQLLASCSTDKTVRLWDLADAKNPALLQTVNTIGSNLHVRWSPCGRWLALINAANLVSLLSFDAATRKLAITRSVGFSNDVNAIEWARDSSRIMLGYAVGTLEVVTVPTLAKESSIKAHGTTVFALQLDPRERCWRQAAQTRSCICGMRRRW